MEDNSPSRDLSPTASDGQGALPLPATKATALSLRLRVCMECGKTARLVTGQDLYPHRPDLYAKRFWKCLCGAYVGCHGGGITPLGYPAGPETRKARSAAHAAFDPMWKGKSRSRSSAYKWLADQLGLDPHATHISWMDEATARRVVEVCVRHGVGRAPRPPQTATTGPGMPPNPSEVKP